MSPRALLWQLPEYLKQLVHFRSIWDEFSNSVLPRRCKLGIVTGHGIILRIGKIKAERLIE